ncbi:aftiphilin [Heteronotia binoei]|uniref:aftiphilin n=1 Tax=Heteronotia binoei TaxID=13085 RepID=UPI0029319CDC|nr:aftiphilin [Heteronotia binoei]
MEPEIIRMYSSSPPPLDNGADEEEDDEFGDFGGFSGAGSSSVGFDFASDYSNSKEDHKSPYNADYPSSVDSIIAFTTVRYVNDADGIAELPDSIKGLPAGAGKEKRECRRLGSSLDDLTSVEVNRTEKSEAPPSDIIRTERRAAGQDQQIDSYNGERPQCPEVLTNGFAALDATNPPGAEDLDGIAGSKALKTVRARSPDLSLASAPSTVEDFADFATFSPEQTAQAEETGGKICRNPSERETLSVHESNIINSTGEGDSMKEAALGGSCEHKGVTCTEGKPVCISKTNIVVHEDSRAKQGSEALEHTDVFSSTQTNVNRGGTADGIEGGGECDAGRSQEGDISRTSDTASPLNLNANSVQDLGSLPAEEPVPVSEMVKNGESELGPASFSDLNEDDFGDFGTVSNGSPAFAVSVSQENVEPPFEKKSCRPANEFRDFPGRNDDHLHSATVVRSEPGELSHCGSEELRRADSGSDMAIQPLAEMENGNNHEFGDFDSVTKRGLDADEFSDFSSAGCNQGTEWNAFESEPEESCSWAAFGDEQVAGSPKKDVWPAHRTDAAAGAEDAASPKADSVSGTPFHGSGRRQPHELPPAQVTTAATTLLSRLERIFEACFPGVPVCKVEEEITPLSLLLEAGGAPGRPEEALAERELLDVWAELQGIHDAYGLRYQWGGSHSNKKLLCSLGIDTRNILFTGNKKQPVIVPMYAAGLGMLEPTKEPLKPISAAEKIASIGQTPPVSPEMNICAPDQFQESLPPVQFDWSSSGLTNPLDANGGSTLLNLDFFGPVEDSSSSFTTTIPGVDPELYELTTSKLETTSAASKVTDAFAKLMSTVEKASTSARKPRKEERLSEEAAQVIASLPDLTFMHAKVLMFPATLTPSASCQDQVD